MSRTDLNHVSETILVPLLSKAYNLPDLRNLNSETINYAGIDLADDTKRVAIQVTSDASSHKVKHTLETFVKHELYKEYGRLIIYVLVDKQKSYSGNGFLDIIGDMFHFDKARDILDYRDFLRVVQAQQLVQAIQILDILEKHFGERVRIQDYYLNPDDLHNLLQVKATELDAWPEDVKPRAVPVAEGLRAYGSKVVEHYDQMQIFGQTKPKPLSGIYVQVNILDKLTRMQHFSAEELHEALGKDSKTLGQVRETRPGLLVANRYRKIIVLGKPGAGKTTFLKLLTLYAINGELRENTLPIFVGLKYWSDSGLTLIQYIINQFDVFGFRDADVFIKVMLQEGKCLVLFDGYDELPDSGQHAIKNIQEFVARYEKNRYVLSCRIAAYHYTFSGFTLVEIADFNSDQIESFVKKWFSEKPLSGEKCWKKIKASPSVKEMASTPLLLTMLCVQFEEAMNFPENRAELYQDAIMALLKKWDTSRQIDRRPIYKELSVVGKESLLNTIAYNAFINDEYFLPQRVVEASIKTYIENIPGVEEKNLEIDSNRILKAIEAHHGLLVERASKVYSFSHLTFQEYFTAKYLVEHQIQLQLTDERMFNPKWKEVTLLTSGLLTSRSVSDNFIKSLRDSIKNFAKQNNLTSFLKIAFKFIKKDSPYTTAATRTLAIIEALTHALARARALDRAIDLAKALDMNLNQDLDQNRALALDRALDRAPGMDLALDQARSLALDRTLAPDLDHNLEIYLQANQLLVDCIKTSYTSKKVREEIFEGILLEW